MSQTSHVHGSIGADANGPLMLAGVFTFNADNSLAGTLAINDSATHASAAVTAGTWTMDPTGRVTLAGANGAYDLQMYLDGNGNALVMSVDAQDSTAGVGFQQVASSADIAEGTYAVAAEGQTYFPIDDNRTLAIEVSGQQLGLVWLEATNASGGGDDD